MTWRKICRSIVNPLPKLWMVFFCFPIFPFFCCTDQTWVIFRYYVFKIQCVYIYVYIYNYIYSPISPLLFQYLSCPGLSCFSYIISVCVFMFNYSFAFIWVILCSMGFINFYLLFLFFICIYLLAPPIRPPSSRPPVLSKEWSDE